MTMLPLPPRRIGAGVAKHLEHWKKPRVCQHPACREPAAELHHIVRRSFLDGPFPTVRIIGEESGEHDGLVWNVAGFCHAHHRQLTDNVASIVWSDSPPEWVWRGMGPLDNPFQHDHAPDQTPLAPCPRCKGRGQVRPRLDLPPAPKRKRTVWAMRVPKDEQENGIEVWETLLNHASETVCERLGYQEDVPPYYVLVAVVSDWLAATPGEVKA